MCPVQFCPLLWRLAGTRTDRGFFRMMGCTSFSAAAISQECRICPDAAVIVRCQAGQLLPYLTILRPGSTILRPPNTYLLLPSLANKNIKCYRIPDRHQHTATLDMYMRVSRWQGRRSRTVVATCCGNLISEHVRNQPQLVIGPSKVHDLMRCRSNRVRGL